MPPAPPSTIGSSARLSSRRASCTRFRSKRKAPSSCSSLAVQPLVERNIERALARPGEILAHAVRDELVPLLGLGIQVKRRIERAREGGRGEGIKHDSGALAARR